MAAEGGTYLPPVVASLIGDSDSLARTLIGAKAMLDDFSKTPTTVDIEVTSLARLQLELLKDIGGLKALAVAHPIDVPMQLDMFQILSETSAFRLFAEKPIDVPIVPQVDLVALAADRAVIGTTIGAAVGPSFWKSLFAGFRWRGALGFGGNAGFGIPGIAGLPFLAGFGTIGGLMGFSVEHVLTVILGLAGSLTEAFAGLGVIAAGAFATMAVGMGSDMAVMKSTITDTQTLYGQWTALEQAILIYGSSSTQAQTASANLNNELLILGNTAGVRAELGLAKLAYTINQQWDKATSNARVQAVNLLTQILILGKTYIPLVAQAAAENLSIIDKGLKPLFAWLEGPQGKGIFLDLEKIFRDNLPTAIHAFDNAIEFLFKFLDLAAQYTGGFTGTLDKLFTYLNSPTGFARVKKDVADVVAVFGQWKAFVIVLAEDIYLLLGQTVGVGTAIVVSLTAMLIKLRDYLQSTSGKSAIGNLFEAHKKEILELISLIPKLAPLAGIYLALAVPLTNIATALIWIVNALLSWPSAGPILAYAAAILILSQRMGLLGLAVKMFGSAAAGGSILGIGAGGAIVIAILGTLVGWIIGLKYNLDLAKRSLDAWEKAFPGAGPAIQNAINSVKNFATTAVADIKSFATTSMTDIEKFFTNLLAAGEKGWKTFASNPSYWLGYVLGYVLTWGAKLVIDGAKAIVNLIGAVNKDLSKLPGEIGTWLGATLPELATWGASLAKSTPTSLGAFTAAVGLELGKLPGQMHTIGQSMVQGIWKGIQSLENWLFSQLESFMKGLVAGALKALVSGSPSKKFAEVGQTIPQGIALGIKTDAAMAMTALSSLFNQMNAQSASLSRSTLGSPNLAMAGVGTRGPISLSAPIYITMPAGAQGSNPQAIAQAVQRAIGDEFDHLITRLQGGVYSTPGT